MAELIIQSNKIKENISILAHYFEERKIHWSLITKVFSGDKTFLKNLLNDSDFLSKIHSIGDSRLSSLKNLKSVNKQIRTIYIKPPAKRYVAEIVQYADISLNTSLETIELLNEAAKKLNKIHQIIIMIELGELREGVQREELLNFYSQVFKLSNIEVIGIGSNLGCMYGVEPSYDKLLQLSLYKELISARFNKTLSLLSGGTSITLPLLENKIVPKEINHFRIGEAAFFGISPLNNIQFLNLNTDTFELHANIIELSEKKLVPEGNIGEANIGHTRTFSENDIKETSTKAILDFGMLDVDRENIEPLDASVKFVGITSDMLVVDLGKNLDEKGITKYHVGDQIKFKPNYMAVARLLNSRFIDKVYC